MLCLVIFWQIIGISHALAEIKIHCGQLTLQGYNACEIIHNDQVVNYTGPEKKVIPDLRFGLITYKCDHMSGYLVSAIDCAHCDFECSMKEQVDNLSCRDDSVQFWLGTILGICIASLIGGFVFKYLYRALDRSSLFNSFFPHQKNSADTNENADEIASMSSVSANYSSSVFLKKETDKKFHQTGEKYAPRNLTDEGKGNFKSTPPSSKKTFLSVLAGVLLFKTARACDVILVMESNNVTMFYYDAKWHNPHPITSTHFDALVGHKICIEDHLGERVSLRVSEITYRIKYELVYYTCDYDITDFITVGSDCDVSDSCSDFNGKSNLCYNKTLAKVPKKLSGNEKLNWFCEHKRFPNTDMFAPRRPVGCITVQKRAKKGELYPVYKKIGETKTAKFIMNRKNDTQAIILSNYEPSYRLTGYPLRGVDEIPIALVGISRRQTFEDFLLLYDNKAYYTHASETNQPRDFFFGDFQISLDKRKEEYAPPFGVTCKLQESGCGNCTAPQVGSMISKLLANKLNLSQAEDSLIRNNDSSIIHTFETVKEGNVRLRIGNLSITDEALQKVKCEIEFVTSYGCTSCNESAYIVLKSSRIEKEGLIPFRSNCSFDKQFVKCDFEPTKLVLKNSYHTCNIRLPTLNKNILIDMKYFNFGHQIKKKRQLNCTVAHASYGEALEHLVTSDRFIGALVKTIIILFISGSILTIAFRVFQTRKNQNCHPATGTNLVDL